MELDDKVKVIRMQFSFSNPFAVPVIARLVEQEKEAPGDRERRKNRETGQLFIEPTEDIWTLPFLEDLRDAEFEVIDLSYRQRIDGKDPNLKRTYQMVRFTFVRKECCLNLLSEETEGVRTAILEAAQEMCGQGTWRVRAYRQEETISINLEARKPFPREPGIYLVITEGRVALVPA